jgi:septal ring factor EnvC (AmiA/AmiB activator)
MKKTSNPLRNEKKDSKKSFYSATVAALVCTMVVGAVYYETKQNTVADSGSQDTKQQASVAGESALDSEWTVEEEAQESKAASAITNAATSTPANAAATGTPQKKEVRVKGNQKKTDSSKKQSSASKTTPVFQVEKGLTWPVKGDVLMKFSENNTIYFKTLAQYKSNPAIEISAQKGTKVIASAAGVVTGISEDDVTGTMVTTDIGSGYSITYGQLKNIKVKQGDEVKEGQLLGVVAKPTKYFSEEGSNLYFQVKENGTAVDPLLLLN